jgi:hypothetical protein
MNNNSNVLTNRPIGVTILGVLFVIGGALALLAGIGTLATVPFASNIVPSINNGLGAGGSSLTPSEQSTLIQGGATAFTIIGIVLIPLGITSLAVAYGLFKAKRWAWSGAVVLSAILFAINVISLVTGNMGAITGAMIGMAINAIVLYYLSRGNVRKYFGKATDRMPSKTLGA